MAAAECRRLCETFGLQQAYLAEIVGRRRHYLAGYGQPSLDKPQQIALSGQVALFWHGPMPPESYAGCRRMFHSLIERLEHELPRCEEGPSTATPQQQREERPT